MKFLRDVLNDVLRRLSAGAASVLAVAYAVDGATEAGWTRLTMFGLGTLFAAMAVDQWQRILRNNDDITLRIKRATGDKLDVHYYPPKEGS